LNSKEYGIEVDQELRKIFTDRVKRGGGIKTKEKMKAGFSHKAEREEEAPAVYDLEPELEEYPNITSEAVDPVKEEEIKDIIEPGPQWSGARDLEID
jgi:hypothetical protein